LNRRQYCQGLVGREVSGGARDDLTAFSEVERLVIELTDAMAATPSNVPNDLYGRLRQQFSEEQLLQLGGQIAFEIIGLV